MEDRKRSNEGILCIKWYKIEELAYKSALFVRVWGVGEYCIAGWGADCDCASDRVIWGRGGGLCLDYVWGER